MTAELIAETRGAGRFIAFAPEEFALSSRIIVRYRINSLEILRQAQKDARAMFLRDLREVGRRSFPDMQLLLHILGNLPPLQMCASLLEGP